MVKWIPVIEKMKQDVIEQQYRLDSIKPAEAPAVSEMRQSLFQPEWKPQMAQRYTPQAEAPVQKAQSVIAPQTQRPMQSISFEQPARLPQQSYQRAPAASVEAPAATQTVVTQSSAKEEAAKPFWQRALQVFSAPFEWIDNNIIRPGLSIVADPFIPDLKRNVGEDYFKYKTREWQSWEAPGVNLKMPWGDMRVDVKGVAEFAPWLLIPGANAIGGVLKTVGTAAKGLGTLGKVVEAGTIVGRVALSPWGLVEKGTGAVLGATLKPVVGAINKAGTKTSQRLFGKSAEAVEVELTPAVVKFNETMKKVVTNRNLFVKAKPEQLRAVQAAKLSKVLDDYKAGKITQDEYVKLSREAEKGSLIEKFNIGSQIAGENAFTEAEVKELRDMIISKAELSHFDKVNQLEAITDTLYYGKLPEPADIKIWREVFGKDVAKTVGQMSELKPSAWSVIWDTMNISRTLQTMADASVIARQDGLLSIMHPTKVPNAIAKMIKAGVSTKWADDAYNALINNPFVTDFESVLGRKLKLNGWNAFAERSEYYPSARAQNLIPGAKASERMFLTYGNELQVGILKDMWPAMKLNGAGPAEAEQIAHAIEVAGGRADLPKALQKYNELLQATLYSPKWQASIIEMPKLIVQMVVSKNQYIRKEGWRALIATMGAGAALLTLGKALGGKIELDPRSSDFGKLKVKETRFDVWRGYSQYVRFAAQMVTAQKKEASGQFTTLNRADTLYKFGQSKTSPAFGMLTDMLKGENYYGRPIFKDTTTALEEAWQRIAPLSMQDARDAFVQYGFNPLSFSTAAASALGVSTMTYVNDFVVARNKVAKQLGYDTWSEIDPVKQQELEKLPMIQQATLEYDRQMMGTLWGDYRADGNAIENNFKEDILLASAAFNAGKMSGYEYRTVYVKDAFTKQRGAYEARQNSERYAEIKERMSINDPVESSVKLGPEQMAIKAYNDALFGTDMYDELGDYRFDEAEIRKAQLKQSMEGVMSSTGIPMFDYIEEYRGIKYEDLPFEYQELAKAKKIMKPYWQVQTDVENIWGKPTNQRQVNLQAARISRIRARVKATSPDIKKYYLLFYQR